MSNNLEKERRRLRAKREQDTALVHLLLGFIVLLIGEALIQAFN